MKRLIIISITIIMFFFKSSETTNNQKSFYDLEIESINGEIIKLKNYRDKVILIVNTASYCGFTKQYEDLQELWDKYKSKGLIVLGVPSDTFNQEKKTNSEVKEFLPLAIASVLIASLGIIIAYQAYFVKKINLSVLFAEKFPDYCSFLNF